MMRDGIGYGIVAMVTAGVAAAMAPAAADAQATAAMAKDRGVGGPALVVGAAVATDVRLRVLTTPPATSDALDGRLQRGFGGSMIDYYPFGEGGFHLSAGGRIAPRGVPRRDEVARLLYAPRGSGVRGSRRLTPAVTMGYTGLVDRSVSLGVEGGVVAGRVDPTSQQVRMPGTARERGANPVVRMALGYRF